MHRSVAVVCRSLLVLGAALLSGPVSAQTLPQHAADLHVGVTSCAGAPCHGAAQALPGVRIRMNEFLTWSDSDKHRLAFAVLRGERSKRIAENLGLSVPADRAPECLNCHTDYVPERLRGRGFSLENGVGCEACHGGSQRWLGLHVAGRSDRAELRAAGLFPTEEPVARARLCLSCHLGEPTVAGGTESLGNKFVSHRLMGAGHPRMSFELNTFTAIQPAHFDSENQAAKGKRVASGVQTWAIGQVMAVDQVTRLLIASGGRAQHNMPDLVFFDCYACHRPIPALAESDQDALAKLRWKQRPDLIGVVGPGTVPFNDANIILTRLLLERVAPGEAKAFGDQLIDLHRAVSQEPAAVVAAATKLRETNTRLIELVGRHAFGREDMRALLTRIIAESQAGMQVNYAAAEQAFMALSSIVVTLQRMGVLNDKDHAEFYAAFGQYRETMKSPQTYQPARTIEAIGGLQRFLERI